VASFTVRGVFDVTAKGKTLLGFFDGAGKFGIGANLTKPTIQGTYTFVNNTLTLTLGGKSEALRVTWSLDGAAFYFTAGDGTKFVCRRKPVFATCKVNRQEHNALVGTRKGLKIHLTVQIDNAPGLDCEVIAFFTDGMSKLLPWKTKTYSRGAFMATTGKYNPPFPYSIWKDLVLFIPYDEFTLKPGQNSFKYMVNVWSVRDNRFVLSQWVWDSFTLPKN
jgi:hypothetical protein